ncbi:hypothetical protein FisN_18Lh036 [Fistulifera solaris]|uniref:Uncharacterized protein n=1 Tax=Fistulifera solaris TaxID=1519565 RepID=A0A1Z5K1S4_FISSO|nr:hypothetical protein FisN_18Lh036 [Fistulifera solaris]|eukprot:GAX20099.1 hypothetical protein FisN_18Lh036 [Fistulifera solaris]
MIGDNGNSLEQFAPDAASLFNNMKTPASIIGGALVSLAIAGPLPLEGSSRESRSLKMARALYNVIGVLSFSSELLVVIWATVASNKLVETHVEPAQSVWHLIERDYNLEWSATNAHFVAGMLGFLVLVALRMFFHADGGLLGMGIAGIPLSALLLMISVINRGVARGSGDGHRYGTNIGSLFTTYVSLLTQRACNKSCVGYLEVGSIVLLLTSMAATCKGVAERYHLGESKKTH